MACAHVVGHVEGEDFAEFRKFFLINKEVESSSYIFDVRLVFKVGGESKSEEKIEEGEDC